MVASTISSRRKTGFWQNMLLVFLFALAVFTIFKSSLFDVKEIEVRGNRQVSEEKIIAASGIHTGVNIFKVNLNDASTNLSAFPAFKGVELHRDFPGKIVITVRERTPVGLIPDTNGFIVIDGDRVYIRKTSTVAEDFPILTGIKISHTGPGKIVNGKGLTVVLQVIEELPAELTGRLSEVHYGDNGSIVIYTLEGNQCRMGSPVNINSKGKMFLQLLQEFEKNSRQIEYVDLSFVGSPVIKYK